MPFTIHHFGISSTIITYDYLHDNAYYHSSTNYSTPWRVKLYDAWANKG